MDKMAKCLRCGEELIGEDVLFDDESKYYHCPNCGTQYVVNEVNENEKMCYPKYNKKLLKDFIDEYHGYEGLCTECGKHIVWSSDFMRSEIIGDIDMEDVDEYGIPTDDSLVSFVTCPYCGVYIEIIEPKPSEIKNYPYWKDEK